MTIEIDYNYKKCREMLNTHESDFKKAERAVAEQAIKETARELRNKGGSPLDVQIFIAGAKRELAHEAGDLQKHGLAAKAAYDYSKLK